MSSNRGHRAGLCAPEVPRTGIRARGDLQERRTRPSDSHIQHPTPAPLPGDSLIRRRYGGGVGNRRRWAERFALSEQQLKVAARQMGTYINRCCERSHATAASLQIRPRCARLLAKPQYFSPPDEVCCWPGGRGGSPGKRRRLGGAVAGREPSAQRTACWGAVAEQGHSRGGAPSGRCCLLWHRRCGACWQGNRRHRGLLAGTLWRSCCWLGTIGTEDCWQGRR